MRQPGDDFLTAETVGFGKLRLDRQIAAHAERAFSGSFLAHELRP